MTAAAAELDLSWFRHAACRGLDPELFHPHQGGDSPRAVAVAVAVCHTCPVQTECLTYALDSNIRDGVWGGHTARHRRTLRANPARRRAALRRIAQREDN